MMWIEFLNLEKKFDDILRRLESYEVDIIRLRAVDAAKRHCACKLESCFSSLRLACSSKHFAHSNLMCGLVLLDPT